MAYITRQDNISTLPLSSRTLNCLHRANIHNIGSMIDYPADQLINIRNMGAKSIDEIQCFLQTLSTGTGEYILVESKNSTESSSQSSVPLCSPNPVNSDDSVVVFLSENGTISQDVSIKQLCLSVRAKNALTRSGYNFASQLVGLTFDELMGLQNMGKKTAEEVLAYLDKISVSHSIRSDSSVSSSPENELVSEMYAAYGENESVWLREFMTVKAQYPEAVGETLIYRLYDSVFVRATVKAKILRIIEENDNMISKTNLEASLPQHLYNTTLLDEFLLELEHTHAVDIGDVMIYRQYPSVINFATQIEDDRTREVIQKRLAGETLNAIGEQYGITRERARQLMNKGLGRRPYLREDKYMYIYDHYDFSSEDFMLAFDEPVETYNYLEMVSSVSRSKKKLLEDVLTDHSVSTDFRRKAERAIYKQYVSTDGVRIKKDRPTLVKHFVKNQCRNLTDYDTFFQKYHEWLGTLGLSDNQALVLESRAYENRINQCDYALWNQWRSFRYYNIPEHDFEDLLSTLNLEQFEDTELSTLKLFRDYPALMQQYDIRDEYELHNLLKKIWPHKNSNVKFSKMPTIEIGNADHKNQVLSLLLQYAPITTEDLATRYEELYGIKARTVCANYLCDLNHYYYNGVYSIDYAALPAIQFDRMKCILDRDFYTIPEVKRLYKREFPNSEESLINPYTLKTLGFSVYAGYSGYIIKDTFSSARDYFNTILTQSDIVDVRKYNPALRNIATYSGVHRQLQSTYEIVEFSPLQYINIRRLNEAGITNAHLTDYCKSVANNCEKGDYFTVTSLRQNGFCHPLDDLGFDEWFYSSILFEDRTNFSSQRIGGTKIFLRGKPDCNLGEMLTWLLEKYQKIDFYDLLDLLTDHYGIILTREKLLPIINGSELYYDAIMDAVYIDYDTYFEEI